MTIDDKVLEKNAKAVLRHHLNQVEERPEYVLIFYNKNDPTSMNGFVRDERVKSYAFQLKSGGSIVFHVRESDEIGRVEGCLNLYACELNGEVFPRAGFERIGKEYSLIGTVPSGKSILSQTQKPEEPEKPAPGPGPIQGWPMKEKREPIYTVIATFNQNGKESC